jgi:hypothetical protein
MYGLTKFSTKKYFHYSQVCYHTLNLYLHKETAKYANFVILIFLINIKSNKTAFNDAKICIILVL